MFVSKCCIQYWNVLSSTHISWNHKESLQTWNCFPEAKYKGICLKISFKYIYIYIYRINCLCTLYTPQHTQPVTLFRTWHIMWDVFCIFYCGTCSDKRGTKSTVRSLDNWRKHHLGVISSLYRCSFFPPWSPWYNCHGWLGVKNQLSIFPSWSPWYNCHGRLGVKKSTIYLPIVGRLRVSQKTDKQFKKAHATPTHTIQNSSPPRLRQWTPPDCGFHWPGIAGNTCRPEKHIQMTSLEMGKRKYIIIYRATLIE